MRVFLLNSVKEGLFAQFFEQKDAELNCAVDGLFDEYFSEAFSKSETPGSLDKATLTLLIGEKFKDDAQLQEEISNELDSREGDTTEFIS